jgi:CubicO group peptidase (beta-lactamase class C family)
VAVICAALVIGACTASPTVTVRPSPSATPASVSASPEPSSPLGAFPEQPAGVPWPTEDWAEAELPAGIDRAAIDEATDLALADGGLQRVRAIVIVHGGAIVYERYSPNAADGPDVVMPSYSVAKSVTSAFIGILVRDGLIDVQDFAPVPEWHPEGADGRGSITIEHMLHMSTGIGWSDDPRDPNSDTGRMLSSADQAAYAAALPQTNPPGETFEYNTGTSILLARIFGQAVGDNPDEVRAFMDRELFDRIGMTPVDTAFDEAGTWLGGYSADSTARAFAKFGLLYVRGGEWDGEQILPTEWVNYTRTPSPANPEYGAQWWLDPARPGVMYAIGFNGQVITVDPAHDLVTVQLSTVGGELPLRQTEVILDAFAEGLAWGS